MRKQDITYPEKLNELKLDISHPNNKGMTYVFVEGESDIRLFRKFFDLNKYKVECIPGGNAKVETCVEEVIKIHPKAIGIRDSDFIQLGDIRYSKINMFLTDYHDLEMTMVNQDEVFSSVVYEFLAEERVDHRTVRQRIINILEQLSYLKWLNEIEKLGLNFEAGFQDLISFARLEIDFLEYFKRTLSKSRNAPDIDFADIKGRIKELHKRNPHPFHLCNGHDFMKCFSEYIRAAKSAKGTHFEFVSSAFRIAYRNEHFAETELFKSTKRWADDNKLSIHL